jgi:hypothetical protein
MVYRVLHQNVHILSTSHGRKLPPFIAQHEYAPLQIQVKARHLQSENIVSHKHDALGNHDLACAPVTFGRHVEEFERRGQGTSLKARHTGQLGGAERCLELGCGVELSRNHSHETTGPSPLLWVSTDVDQRALSLCRQKLCSQWY